MSSITGRRLIWLTIAMASLMPATGLSFDHPSSAPHWPPWHYRHQATDGPPWATTGEVPGPSPTAAADLGATRDVTISGTMLDAASGLPVLGWVDVFAEQGNWVTNGGADPGTTVPTSAPEMPSPSAAVARTATGARSAVSRAATTSSSRPSTATSASCGTTSRASMTSVIRLPGRCSAPSPACRSAGS